MTLKSRAHAVVLAVVAVLLIGGPAQAQCCNTATGDGALISNTSGDYNTATGWGSMSTNSTGSYNTATGEESLNFNTTGAENTATGGRALFRNRTGYDNTATGRGALFTNDSGFYNTATGAFSLTSNISGVYNTATGFRALRHNTTGYANTASGLDALYSNTTGYWNTATGASALHNNTTGYFNTATGLNTLYSNTTGSYNIATGLGALQNNTTGYANIALGLQAGYNVTTGHDNIDIANRGVAGESDTIRIGTSGVQVATHIAGIHGEGATGGLAVYVTSDDKLGVQLSSRRVKDDIRDMGAASQGLLRLRPVTFRYTQAGADGARPLQYGLIAEEVAEVSPELVAYDRAGQPQTVLYHALPAMLLNELQRQERQLEGQAAELTALRSRLAIIEAALSGAGGPQAALTGSR